MSINTLCYIRDIFLAIKSFEELFQKEYGLSLNEGMLLCTLKDEKLTAGELAEKLHLSNSNTSKVIKAVEQKGLIERIIDKEDKRLMRFRLTKKAKDLVNSCDCESLDKPKVLEEILCSKNIE